MSHPIPAILLASILASITLAGCLGGSPEACPAHHAHEGEEDAPTMELVEEPDIRNGDGWSLLVQCASEHMPLAAYKFTLETPGGRLLVVEPVGTWTSPAVLYAPTNGTTEGDEVRATPENPGNAGDPTYRFELIDEEQNGLVDAGDDIRITYDAGEAGTTTFQSPFEGGQYLFSVYLKDGDVLIFQTPKNFPDPAIAVGAQG